MALHQFKQISDSSIVENNLIVDRDHGGAPTNNNPPIHEDRRKKNTTKLLGNVKPNQHGSEPEYFYFEITSSR
jgi:hypothetical protein